MTFIFVNNLFFLPKRNYLYSSCVHFIFFISFFLIPFFFFLPFYNRIRRYRLPMWLVQNADLNVICTYRLLKVRLENKVKINKKLEAARDRKYTDAID